LARIFRLLGHPLSELPTDTTTTPSVINKFQKSISE